MRRCGVSLFAAAMGLAVVLGPGAEAEAGKRRMPRPLEHHATVLNGAVVGSAFGIVEGHALTNAHVVEGLRPGAPVTLVASGGGEARVSARVVGISDRMDLALLEVPPGFLPVVAAADAPLRAGLPVIAAGIDAGGGTNGLPRMVLAGRVVETRSRVSAFGPGLVASLPGVRPGFSGGPMLDAEGRLVGMIAAIRPGNAARRPAAAAGAAAGRRGPADEALVLRAAEIRAEALRLLDAGRR